MTGFGQGTAEKNGERFVVTLKSLNHRYFETSFHLPMGFDHLEASLRNKLASKIQRGRVNVSVSHVNESSDVIMINHALAKTFFNALEQLRKSLKVPEPMSIDALVGMPGVLAHRKKELAPGERVSLVDRAFAEALSKLLAMRAREGVALAADLKKRVEKITAHMRKIKKRVREVLAVNKKTMPPDILEGFLRSTDVSEEITRIDFHLKSFLKHLRDREAKGKILDFIGQELQREINTLGAKVQEKHVGYEVVLIKDQIEKIREQVQNVE
ncbi:MAG: DUF1732 domain-containing protein [Candidatus Omnitrophota bacterium]